MNDKDYFGKRALAERAAALAAKDMASFRIHMDLAIAYEQRAGQERIEVFRDAAYFGRDRAQAAERAGLSLAEGQARQQLSRRRQEPVLPPMPWFRN
jgi:uncharacterized protein (DUF2141 family)